MNPRRAIASSLHLFTVLAFFSAGFFFFALAYFAEVRLQISDFLLFRYELCTPIAFGFLLAAFLLFLGFYGVNRGKTLRLKMGGATASIDAEVIRQTLEEHFKRHFPDRVFVSDVEVFRAKRLEIEISLSLPPDEAREEFLTKAEQSLKTLFRERFGYSKPFYLSVKTQ